MNTEQIEHSIKCCIFGSCRGCPRQAKEYPAGRSDCKELLYGYVVEALRAQQERENPQPLTLDELKERVGKPVYVVFSGVEKYPAWKRWLVIEKITGEILMFYGKMGYFTADDPYTVYYDHEPKEAE